MKIKKEDLNQKYCQYNRLSRTRLVVLENEHSPVVIEDNRGRSIL